MSILKPWESGQEAKKISQESITKFKESEGKTKKQQKELQVKLEELGALKLEVYNKELRNFVDIFSKIKHADLSELNDFNKELKFNKSSFVEMKEQTFSVVDASKSLLAGTAAGGLAGFAALGSVATFGAASTGTAIATLSGAAAKSALLAWFGGGAIAAGGAGVAGGTLVVGGLFAAPALIVAPLVWNTLGKKKLEEAKKMRAEINKACSEFEVVQKLMTAISERVDLHARALSESQDTFNCLLITLEELVNIDADYDNYREEDKYFLANCVLMAKLLINIVRLPVVTESGKLAENEQEIIDCQNQINEIPTMILKIF